jgi:plasmid stabilization system protein ParE
MVEIVVEEILWTDSAKLSFSKIISYINANWTEKEVLKFIDRTTEVLATLQRYPEMCRPSVKRKNVRIALLNKHTQMIYHYKPRKNK